MKNRSLLAALLAVPLTFTSLGTATAAPTAGPDLHVDSLVLSRGSVAVSSLNTVPVTVTMTGSAKPSGYDTFYVEFTGDLYSMPMKLIKGTLDDGTWQGVVNVPSTANGTLKALRVMAGSYYFGCSSCELEYPVQVDGPTLAVTGVHRPKIVGTATPAVVPIDKPVTIKWTITDSQTGKPYGTRIKTWPAKDNTCVEGEPATALTGTNGVLSILDKSNYGLYCLRIPGTPGPIASSWLRVKSSTIISATPSKTSAAVGSIVPVNGTAPYASGCTVNLQRLYGASQWRTVGTAKVRASARFTLNAQPAYRGNIPYRVQFPACNNFVAGISKSFTIRGI